MKNSKTLFITRGAMIAAAYVVLTHVTHLLGIDSGIIQIRLSEALTVLPVFFPEAIPGLLIGCFISNMLCEGVWFDMIFGSLATLIGAVGTYLLRKHPYLAPIPPIVSNMLIIPYVLIYAYGAEDALPLLMLSIAISEIICAGILGTMLVITMKKYFKNKNISAWK